MKKETLSLHNITQDLKTVANLQLSNTASWRLSFIIPITLLSVIGGVILKNVWIALMIFSVAAYHIVRFVIEIKNNAIRKKTIVDAVDRADISISTERFDHIATETVYEPHIVAARGHANKIVKYFYFASGSRWRVPNVDKHYKWSNEYYISSKGLENISIQGDEFYYISLQGNPDISYIYPCKNFVLDERLNGERCGAYE